MTLRLYMISDTTMGAPRVASLGWELQADGLFRDCYGPFNILTISWEEVCLRIKLAWPQVMSNEVIHRSSMDGLHLCELGELQRVFTTRNDADGALLRCHLDGTLFTQNGRANFEPDTDDTCPWCSQKDGFSHRAWECAHFQDDRQGVPQQLIQALPALPRSFTCHNWPWGSRL